MLTLFADAKSREDLVQNIVGIDSAHDLAEGIQSAAQLSRRHLVTAIFLNRAARAAERVGRLPKRLLAAAGRARHYVSVCRLVSFQRVDDLPAERFNTFAGDAARCHLAIISHTQQSLVDLRGDNDARRFTNRRIDAPSLSLGKLP